MEDRAIQDAREGLTPAESRRKELWGSVPVPLLYAGLAAVLMLPNHRIWWDWVMGSSAGREQVALTAAQSALQAELQKQMMATGQVSPIVLLNQLDFGGHRLGSFPVPQPLAASRRGRWVLIVGVLAMLGYSGFRAGWREHLAPRMRRWLYRLAEPLNLLVVPKPPPFDPDRDAEVLSSVAQLRLELAATRGALATHKDEALRRLASKEQELVERLAQR